MKEKEFRIAGGSLHYEKRSDEIIIIGLQGLVSEVEIPVRIEECPVTALEKKAFLSKKYLRRISIPHTVTEVGDWAFAYCDNLEQVEFAGQGLRFGRAVFLECGKLKRLMIAGKSETAAALLAAAVTVAEAYYLLEPEEAGSCEWLAKWDARMLAVLRSPDSEGYSKQVLCGEEDYGSTDLNAFLQEKRKLKVRLLLLRLLYSEGLSKQIGEELKEYLRAHTKGCESEETWQVVLEEHGNDREYYQLFAELSCIDAHNLEGILADIGEEYPEMKAFFMRYKQECIGDTDFFADLSLDI